jgi:hypothetical protein
MVTTAAKISILSARTFSGRSNYATRTLMRWVEEGRDIEAWLPHLAAYMGHQKYSSTAWYVHLLPERLAATGLTSAAGIIPAVTS